MTVPLLTQIQDITRRLYVMSHELDKEDARMRGLEEEVPRACPKDASCIMSAFSQMATSVSDVEQKVNKVIDVSRELRQAHQILEKNNAVTRSFTVNYVKVLRDLVTAGVGLPEPEECGTIETHGDANAALARLVNALDEFLIGSERAVQATEA